MVYVLGMGTAFTVYLSNNPPDFEATIMIPQFREKKTEAQRGCHASHKVTPSVRGAS